MIDYSSRYLMICLLLVALLSNGCSSSTTSKQNDNANVSNQNDNTNTSSSTPSNSPPIIVPAGQPQKDDDFPTSITRFKKNVSLQLMSLKNARFLERFSSFGGDERAKAFLLLGEYDKANREIFLSRLESIPKESLDLWMVALAEKSGEDAEQFTTFHRLPHIEFLFTDNQYNKSIEDKYLQRVRGIPKDIVNDWSVALTPFDMEDSFPMSNTLLVMINLESLFDGANLKNDVLQRKLARLKQLQPERIVSLAARLKCQNLKLFAANIAATDAFFVDEVFQEALVTKSIKTK